MDIIEVMFIGLCISIFALLVGIFLGAFFWSDSFKNMRKINAHMSMRRKLLEEKLRDKVLMKGGMDLNIAQERNIYNDINKNPVDDAFKNKQKNDN